MSFHTGLSLPSPSSPRFLVVYYSHCHLHHHHHPNPFCSQAKRRWEVVLCVHKSIGLTHLWIRQERHHNCIQLYSVCEGGCLPACLMHYWEVHLSHQLQVEGWNSVISSCRQKRVEKHSWPQLKSSVCEVEADVADVGRNVSSGLSENLTCNKIQKILSKKLDYFIKSNVLWKDYGVIHGFNKVIIKDT